MQALIIPALHFALELMSYILHHYAVKYILWKTGQSEFKN